MNEINPAFLNTINNPRYQGINTNWRDEISEQDLIKIIT